MSSIAEIGVGGAFSALLHPTGYAKVLIQLGHEPLAPTPCKRFLFCGRTVQCYPNVLQYCKFIYQCDGFLGMYQGLMPRLVGGYLGSYCSTAVLAELKKDQQNQNDDEDLPVDWVKVLLLETAQESLAKISGVIISQPFHVLMVRQMAQFVGGETAYNGLFGGMREIYQTEGLRGFFCGLVPRLIGEVMFIWMGKIVACLVNRYIIESKEAQSYMGSVCGFFASMVTYRFTLISNIMAVSGTDLQAAGPPAMRPYSNWLDCYSHLRSEGALSRGSSTFFRYINPRAKSFGLGAPVMIRQPRY